MEIDRLHLIWDLAEQFGAVQVGDFSDAETEERDYKFPSKSAEQKFIREVHRRGLM